MPVSHIPDPHLSSSRWFGSFRRVSGDRPNSDEIEDQIFSIVAGGECYACTQVGVPVFHSTSCDGANQPEWEASAGSSLLPIKNRTGQKHSGNQFRSGRGGSFWRVLDPRSKRVQRWNRVFLLARGLALAVDPLFFYSLSIGRGGAPGLNFDGGLAAAAAMLRTGVDSVHLCHLWLQFRLAYVSRESLVIGCGKLVWDARAVAAHYVRSLRGFWFDVFVILPVPQIVFWLVVPRLIKENQIHSIMTILLLIFLFQFLPKVYHSICLMRRMQKVTGYIFGTIWWGFGLNLIAYFIASHVAGGCWYVLAIQRVASCLNQQCINNQSCNISKCLDVDGPYQYGIYKWALPVVSSNSIAVKILYPIFWGLMTLSTFGNDLEPTSQGLEVLFSISAVLSGLLLFTLLIGNIQVFLHAVMAKKRKMQLRCRDMEWWMKRRRLPLQLRQRVRRYERHRWSVVGGDDEMDIVKDLPEGLRRDIKRFLCLDLIKQVPLFHSLDELILDNICDRVKPILISKDEKATCGVLRVVEMGLKLSKKEKESKSPDNSSNNNNTSVQYVHNRVVNCLWKNYIRNLVSKKRRRMLIAGYDLDMTYINDRILAMSFPAERMRAMYRNPLWQVKSVLEMSHRNHYKVYNLCIEEEYDPLHFNGCVERYPFDDNHVPPLSMIKEFCEDVHSWLASDPKNIAVVHCMAGKGRTGLMVSSYLVYTGMSAEKALQMYAERRTTNNEGVSIASQRRYVAYWEKACSYGQGVDLTSPYANLPPPCTRELQHIRLYDTVNINQIFVVVNELQEMSGPRYRPPVEISKTCCRKIGTDNDKSYESRYYYSFVEGEEGRKDPEEEPHLVVQMDTESSIIYQKTCLGHHYEKPLPLTGDVRIIFYEKLIGGRIFYVCFNTFFITGSLLQFTIKDLDKVGQKGRSICGPSFCLELFFGPSNANNCLMPSNEDELYSN